MAQEICKIDATLENAKVSSNWHPLIYCSNENGENVVSLSNFSGEPQNVDLETIFSQNLLLILLSTTQDHVILGEYLARDFVMYPYEGVTITFINE